MKEYGYVRVGAIVPELKVANPLYNIDEIIKQIDIAISKKVDIISFPELCITGYTCADLFHQNILIEEAYKALDKLVKYSINKEITIIIGMPLIINNGLYNVAVVINKGNILGIVPKTYIPNYNEFYEKRWFLSSEDLKTDVIRLFDKDIPIGTNILFTDSKYNDIKFGIEICEDVWSIYPPSERHALKGATLIFNLSASNEIIGKYNYRKNLIKMHSSKIVSGYIYTSAGINESSTDLVFSGSSMIYENGNLLKENNRFDFNSNIITADIDVSSLINDRIKDISYTGIVNDYQYKTVYYDVNNKSELEREYSKTPFIPSNDLDIDIRCNEILNIQSCGLATRLKHTGITKTVIGISGGLDSTLAFLVILEAYKKLGINNSNIIAVTMPGFGTTNRTKNNATKLVKQYGATLIEIPINKSCEQHYKDINLDISKQDVVFENTQARERTQILMDIANQKNGLVIGTGDLSELALGWCTYNGDHMSMYAVNTSIPKTLVKYLVKYIAKRDNNNILSDILDTPISPELLPPDKDDNIKQKTEDKIGPYILHDYFLYYFLRYGMSPKKIYYIAVNTFKDVYKKEEIKKWLIVFLKRFISQQFKRSCLPDGVKVGSISLSPRGDLRMPSDASNEIWIGDLDV